MHFSLCDPHNDSLQEETKMNLQGKRVLVFGTGKSGIGAADLLEETGAHVILFDGNEKTDKDAVLTKYLTQRMPLFMPVSFLRKFWKVLIWLY